MGPRVPFVSNPFGAIRSNKVAKTKIVRTFLNLSVSPMVGSIRYCLANP